MHEASARFHATAAVKVEGKHQRETRARLRPATDASNALAGAIGENKQIVLRAEAKFCPPQLSSLAFYNKRFNPTMTPSKSDCSPIKRCRQLSRTDENSAPQTDRTVCNAGEAVALIWQFAAAITKLGYRLHITTTQPYLGHELRPELERAGTFHNFVRKAFPKTFTVVNDRVNMLAAKTHLADDLYGSILYLFSAGGSYDGGAFALVRPLLEASVEGQWQFFCAEDETFRRAYAGEDVDPGLPNMMGELDRIAGYPVFADLRAKFRTLHGFTHGGLEQLGCRFDAEGNLRANYPDQLKSEAIRISTSTYALLGSVFCQAASGSPEKDMSSAAIEEQYSELYGPTA